MLTAVVGKWQVYTNSQLPASETNWTITNNCNNDLHCWTFKPEEPALKQMWTLILEVNGAHKITNEKVLFKSICRIIVIND